MLLKGNAIIEGTATIETLPISNSSLSAVVQIDGSLYKRELGSISTAAKEAYIPGLSVSFPTIFNLNTEGLDYNNRSLVVSLKNQLQGTAFMAPVTMTGTPAFRRIVKSDLTDASVLFSDDSRIANWNTAFARGDFRQFGLGNIPAVSLNSFGAINQDWNTIPIAKTGFVYGSNTSVNYPGAGSEYPVGLKIGFNENIGATIVVGRGPIPELRFRPDNNGNTFPWARVWHDKNLTKLSQLQNDLPSQIQTLSLGANAGKIEISNGNAVRLSDLTLTNRQDSNVRLKEMSFTPYYSSSNNTNYPSNTVGAGIRLERNSTAIAQSGFDIHKTVGQDYLWYKTFDSLDTERDWKIIADREWVHSNTNGKYISNSLGDSGYTELYSGDIDELPTGNYVQAISGGAINLPIGIGTVRSLFVFGSRNLTDRQLTSMIAIGSSGLVFKNGTNNIWRTVWTNTNLTDPATQTWINTQGYLKSVDLQNYYTKAESVNQFVGVSNVQNIGGTKTFTVSPIVPTATLSSHAINKGQVESWVNSQGFVTIDTTYNRFTRTIDGLVPAPTGSTSTRYLREDGTWVIPTNTTYSAGTLDLLEAGVNTANRVWSAKVLSDYITTLIPPSQNIWSLVGTTNITTIGLNSIVIGSNSQSIGIGTYVKGNNNIGQGYNITTIGGYITHIGNNGYSYGSNLLALGNYNNIDGSNITVLGHGLEGNEEGVTIVGKYNKPSNSPIASGTTDSNLFVIGGGKSAFDRANAYEMKNDFRGIFFGKQKYYYDYADFSGNEIPSALWVMNKISQSGGGSSFRLRSFNENFLTGDVTLIPGSGITLSQSGNNITISSNGGGGGGSDNSINTATNNVNTEGFNGIYDGDSNIMGGIMIESVIGLGVTLMQSFGEWNQASNHVDFYGEWAVLVDETQPVTQGTIIIRNTKAYTLMVDMKYYLIAKQNSYNDGTATCEFVDYSTLKTYKEQAQINREIDLVLLGKITYHPYEKDVYLLKVNQHFF